MLILTRRCEQAIIIETSDGPIVVRVLGIERGRVLVGVQADKKVRILREELISGSHRL